MDVTAFMDDLRRLDMRREKIGVYDGGLVKSGRLAVETDMDGCTIAG